MWQWWLLQASSIEHFPASHATKNIEFQRAVVYLGIYAHRALTCKPQVNTCTPAAGAEVLIVDISLVPHVDPTLVSLEGLLTHPEAPNT